MEGFLLLALLLLGGFGGVSTRIAGELCRAWNYKIDSLVGAFQCPEGLDATHARFCCETCTAPYCCSLREPYLDQAQCAQKTEVGPALPIVHGDKHDSLIVVFYWFGVFVCIFLLCLLLKCCCTDCLELWLLSMQLSGLRRIRRRMHRTRLESVEQDELDIPVRPQLKPRQHHRARRGRGKE